MKALWKALLVASFGFDAIDAAPPPNDDYCSPYALGSGFLPTGGADLVEIGATNVDATGPQPGEPDGGSAWFDGDGVQNSVWYAFELSAGVSCINIFLNNGVLQLDWQFALYEYDGTSCPANTPSFTLVAADDDSGGSLGTGPLTPYLKDIYVSDGTYALQVDGFAGTEGIADIYVQECFPPDNDDYCYPTYEGTLTLGSELVFPTTNVDAIAQPGEPIPPEGSGCGDQSCLSQDGWCNFSGEPSIQNSVWHQFDVYGPECIEISWDGPGYPDLQFALYEIDGACDTENFYDSFSLIAANDDSGPTIWSPQIVGAPVDSGKTYVLQVDGYAGEEATGYIRIESFETGGCNPDLDDDGVLNEDDLCPNSDIDEDFDINGCVTTISPQVAGGVFSNGCTPLQELSRVCFQNFKNPAGNIAPGQVRACTAQVLKGWVADGIIQANERGKIMKCLKNVCTTTCAAN